MNLQSVLEQRAKVEEFTRKHRIGLLTLLFTDLVGSTKLKQELGDQKAVALIQRHRALVRELLGGFKEGEEIETAGDSFFIVFTKPSDAAEFSLLLQNRLRRESQQLSQPLLDRVGIHIGEVVIEERGDSAKQKDLYGLQVDICARVMSLAEGNQILLTRSALDNARQVLKGESIDGVGTLAWMNHGPYLLKGVEEPMEICEVGEVGLAVLKPPPDSEKVHRYLSPDAEPVLGWRPAINQEVPGTSWVLQEKLGEGGFGEVWLGLHRKLNEKRVFKFCFRADRVRALKREVTLFRLLRERVGEHPNVVQLKEVFFNDPPFYIEMEYVEGRDLKTWIEAQGGFGRVSLETRLEIVAQVADALQAAHEAGVIHRDVKPGNILLNAARPMTRERQPMSGAPGLSLVSHPSSLRVKLADFGIGQVVSEEVLAGVTRHGFTETMFAPGHATHAGTYLYLAPELLSGKAVSPRSDLYSLGVVLYQMIVGDFSRPITGDWIREVSDPVLQEDLRRCLAGQPADRVSDGRTLAEGLRTLANRQKLHIANTHSDRAEELLEQGDAHSAVAFMASALRHDPSNQSIATRLVTTLSHRIFPLPAFEPIQPGGPIGEAQISPNGKHIVAAFCEPTPPGFVVQSALFRVWDSVTGKPISQPIRHEGMVHAIRVSPDGKWVASACSDKRVRIWKIGEWSAPSAVLQHRREVFHVEFSPDGQFVATAAFDYTARVWHAYTGQPVTPWLRHPDNAVLHAAFNRKGDRLVTTCDLSSIRVWEVPSGKLCFSVPHGFFPATAARFSPDGKRIAAGFKDSTARILDAQSGRFLTAPLRHSSEVCSVQFSPEGARLLTVSIDGAARIWDSETGELLIELMKAKANVPQHISNHFSSPLAVFSDHGLWVLVREDHRILILDPRTGEPMVEPIPLLGQKSVQFTRDGRQMLTASGDGIILWNLRLGQKLFPCVIPQSSSMHFIQGSHMVSNSFGREGAIVIDSATGEELRVLPHQGVEAVRVSPNADRIATIGQPACNFGDARMGTVRLWEVETGTLLVEAKVESCGAAEFSPDGKRLLIVGNSARVWDATSGQSLSGFLTHKHTAELAQFNPTGTLVCTASSTEVWVWDVLTGQLICELVHRDERREAGIAKFREDGHRETPSLLKAQFDPDGERLLTVSPYVLCVWNLRDGTGIRLERDVPIQFASFGGDRHEVVTISGGKIHRLSSKTGELVGAAVGEALPPFELSPDGRYLAVCLGPEIPVVRVYFLWRDDRKVDLKENGQVTGLKFSSDGERLLVITRDGSTRLWDLSTARKLFETPAGGAKFWGALTQLSPDKQRILLESSSGNYCVWEIPTLNRPPPEWLPEIAELVVGYRIDQDQVLPQPRTAQLAELSKRLIESLESDSYTQWLKWYFSSGTARTISPRSSITVRRHVESTNELSGVIQIGPENVEKFGARLAAQHMTYPMENPREAAQADWLSQRATELLPFDAGVWALRAGILQEMKRGPEALEAVSRAIKLEPRNAQYRRAQALYYRTLGQQDEAVSAMAALIDENPEDFSTWFEFAMFFLAPGKRFEEAYGALTKALVLAGDDESKRRHVCHARCHVLKKLNRFTEAGSNNLEALGIPARSVQVPSNLIDLSPYYDQSLEEHPGLATLPRGRTKLAGTEFDLRGVIRQGGLIYSGGGEQYDPSHERYSCRILIEQECRAVHFLFSARGLEEEEDGIVVCAVVFQLDAQERHKAELILGRDVPKRSRTSVEASETPFPVAWSQETGEPGADGVNRLFSKIWENPTPGAKVKWIDFIRGPDLFSESAACYLFAVTIH